MPVRPRLRLPPEDLGVLMVRGLVGVNEAQMRRAGPRRPRIRDLIRQRRLRYSRMDPLEHFQTYDELAAGARSRRLVVADCEDLAAAEAAEMRDPADEFFDPDATTRVYRTGPRMSHVIVDSPRFGPQDPSISAGMGWDEVPIEDTALGGTDGRKMRATFRLAPDEAAELLNGGLVGVNLLQRRRWSGGQRPRVLDLVRSGRIRFDPADPDDHWQSWRELVSDAEAGVAAADDEDLVGAVLSELADPEDTAFYDPRARARIHFHGPDAHWLVDSPRHGLWDPRHV